MYFKYQLQMAFLNLKQNIFHSCSILVLLLGIYSLCLFACSRTRIQPAQWKKHFMKNMSIRTIKDTGYIIPVGSWESQDTKTMP